MYKYAKLLNNNAILPFTFISQLLKKEQGNIQQQQQQQQRHQLSFRQTLTGL